MYRHHACPSALIACLLLARAGALVVVLPHRSNQSPAPARIAAVSCPSPSTASLIAKRREKDRNDFSSFWLPSTVLFAKRRKKDQDDFSSWYDDVDEDASPDDVFWEEMERQKLLNQIGGDEGGGGGGGGGSRQTYVAGSSASTRAPGMTIEEERSAEATLASYKPFMVSDNWLDERYAQEVSDEEDGDEDGEQYDEPWDHWGVDQTKWDNRRIRLDPEKLKSIPELEKYRMPYEGLSQEEVDAEEEKYRERLSWITIKSQRLENARGNPKAKAYFARKPNSREGFDRMWVSAIENGCIRNLIGVYRDYGVEFADNFGDWEDQSTEDGQWSIEDVASFKARQVYEVTGLPCIASRTSFEIEPARARPEADVPGRVSTMNPRVASGYKFNDAGEHVDYLIEALKPQSDPSRVTRFTTCLCYYDGEVEVYDYGECDCDIYFSTSERAFIPMSSAINEMCKTLQLSFGLEYQKWLKEKVREAMGGHGGASLKLRDRVLKDAIVLPNEIIDVSAFMDSKVDVNLMDECAQELANRFMNVKPSKILTVATTGLVIAIPMAKYLQVPVVYARKERNVVMADTFQASYSSKTVGKNRELLVSTKHLDEDDRVLIVDDFLSSGSSQDALLRIVSDAGATAVGVGVLMEKIYDSGRQSLSGYNVPVESLVGVRSVKEGVIRLQEEEGIEDVEP